MKPRTIYLLLVFALGVLACMSITVGVTLSVVQRQNREIQRQELRQQEEGRRATCALVGRILAAVRSRRRRPAERDPNERDQRLAGHRPPCSLRRDVDR